MHLSFITVVDRQGSFELTYELLDLRGGRVRVKTAVRKARGAVVSAGERSVRIENGAGEPLDIPYDEVVRANLIDEG